ncbi:hypothetical protein GCM10008171_12540 [Methylopila jiangsuensis]|uniref:Uncharacterized protein n=1 Tax=Methylopila jiangsuensis TaxID=586230 RepID=A0A9W6N362_9HYPH|nr:hypothetical protein [Methylopila jiangsuensis]MDR6286239.1 hypothetical protein [Methylopila jiangsuensis]GLK76000.1 hypothetical protein GCM10008171_12540 [Methylopila jiangsuensis]
MTISRPLKAPSRKALIGRALGSLVDLRPARIAASPSVSRSDAAALRGDWERLGRDLRRAIAKTTTRKE